MIPTEIPSYIFFIVKITVIVGVLIYSVFAGVLVRQEQLMAHVLEQQFQPFLRSLVIIHLVATLLLLFAAIVLL